MQHDKKILIALGVFIVIAGILFSKYQHNEDLLIVEPTGNPQQPMLPQPVSSCGITILNPLPYTKINIPITVEAIVDNSKATTCRWTVFEAQAGTVLVKTASGVDVGKGILMTDDNWMTTDPVLFEASITFTQPVPSGENLVFIITEDDPSGGAEGTAEVVSISVVTQ